ncbi:HNH endonuclease [Pseudomonas aeruginosa]|nr:HNH endonuclease [Pseudomonas aeruginosa]
MSQLIDLSGREFGRLSVLEKAGRDGTGKTLWRCECRCGQITFATGLNLRSGNTKSCGCLKRRTGSDNPKYKKPDPVTTHRRKRAGSAYKQWRASVSTRCPVCLRCGTEATQSHHVLGYAEHPEMAYEPKNGVSLCEPCHREYHIKYGRKSGFGPDSLRVFVEGPGSEVMTSVLLANGIEDLKKAKHYIELLIELESQQESV